MFAPNADGVHFPCQGFVDNSIIREPITITLTILDNQNSSLFYSSNYKTLLLELCIPENPLGPSTSQLITFNNKSGVIGQIILVPLISGSSFSTETFQNIQENFVNGININGNKIFANMIIRGRYFSRA